MSFIRILFCLMTLVIIIYSSLINFLESKLPHFVSQIFRYGKFAVAMAFFEYTFVLWLVSMVYIFNMEVPVVIHSLLDLVCGKERIANTSKHKVFIAVCLMTLQVYRRFYDTQYVSVYGTKSKMNLSHYLIGLIHYPAAALAILCEAPLFANTSDKLQFESLNLSSMSFSDKVAILIFLVAWKHQYSCTKILGNLRKNKEGAIATNGYRLPEGDWFEYLSAPHQTAEIIMYSCIMWILWNNITWFFVFAWVLANQVETILLSHWWYQEKFEDFPKKRKALIPFLY